MIETNTKVDSRIVFHTGFQSLVQVEKDGGDVTDVTFENGVSVQSVHDGLIERDFHGGIIIKQRFPHLGESMLFCVTDIQTKDSIDQIVEAVREIVTKEGEK